jgi:hypothetical protein
MEPKVKKLLLTAAAVAMPIGLVCASGGAAQAAAPKVNVSNATISCTAVTGSAKFSPALNLTGGNPENTSVKLAVSGCTVSGVSGVVIASGKGSGVLHSASNLATNLLGPTAVTGSVGIKWKTSTGKLSFPTSTVTVSVVTGGTPSDGYASLAITAGNATVSNDFAGTDGGASSTMYAETTQTVSQLTTAATGKKGLKSITLGTDGTHTTPNSLHLG